MRRTITLLAPFALLACGTDTPAENKAEQLEEAAEQSTPAAADVLENAAERIEEGEVEDPDAAAQDALNVAANAQIQNAQ